jgi:hypothetical protein
MRNFNGYAQEKRELWMIRRVAPRLLGDRSVRLEDGPHPSSNPGVLRRIVLARTDWNGTRARARLAFERLFTIPTLDS